MAMEAAATRAGPRGDGLILLLHAAVRPLRRRARLHQGLSARRARERRPVHATPALWAIWAFAELGDGDRAAQLFALPQPASRAPTAPTRCRALSRRALRRSPPTSTARRPHAGRGGWTWYTGSAAWTWRLGVEGILGLRLVGGKLAIRPCLPLGWAFYEADITGPGGTLAVRVEDPDGVGTGVGAVTVDGIRSPDGLVAFPTGGAMRRISVRLRAAGVGSQDDPAVTVPA